MNIRQEENQNGEQQIQGYNPCSLCQGLTLLADKIPFPQFDPNATCADANAMFEDPAYVLKGNGRNFVAPNATINNPGGCRAEPAFNLMFVACCRASIPTFRCEQNVHAYILGDSEYYSEYNTVIPPAVGPEPDQKLNVSVFLQYETLEHIEVGEGTATLFVSIQLKWNDPRLKWDVDDYDMCSNSVNVWTGHDVETTSIWIPDLDVMNKIEGLQTMDSAKAVVYSDGTVEWFIAGGLKTFCAFTGLGTIPFDTLGCQILFGSHLHNSLINYDLETPDYVFYGLFDVTYNEWKAIPELGNQGTTWGGNGIYYNIYFKRATQHYIQNVVVPTAMLTYLSFLTFLLDMRVGERLGFGMAIALVVIAQQIVTSGMTPISNQNLWLDKFVGFSFYWVLVGVVQSVLIGFLFYLREDYQAKHETANSEGQSPIEASEEEQRPLTMQHERDGTDGSSERIESATAKYAGGVSDNKTKRGSVLKVARKIFFYKYSLRKIDMMSLIFCVVSYTLFIAFMYMSVHNESWLQNDPQWFDETFNQYSQEPYINGDPNN